MKLVAAVATVSLLAVPALADEPTLAEAAARQKKARTGQTRVITEDDLRGSRTREAAPRESAPSDAKASPTQAQPGEATAATAAQPPAKSEADQRTEKKADIEAKVKQWNGFIADTRKSMEAAQLELNDLSSLTFGNRRAGLQKILDEGARQVAEAQQTIAGLQEEARRGGIALSQ